MQAPTASLGGRRWAWPERPEPGSPLALRAAAVSAALDAPPALGRALAGRGMDAAAAVALSSASLVEATREIGEPPGTAAAAALLLGLAARGPVGILPDYDVDGGTSQAILVEALRAVGADYRVAVPDRDAEGFGPNDRCLDELAAAGCGCVVTLDCGTAEGELLDAAMHRHGLIPVVVDHHPLRGVVPPKGGVLVNPHSGVEGGGAAPPPLGAVCTAGLAWFLALALLRGAHLPKERTLEVRRRITALAALGTVCDVMPLDVRWNRAVVVAGTAQFGVAGALGPGLAAIAGNAGVEGVPAAADFGWRIGPRINAGSRMGRSGLAAACLREADGSLAEGMARELEALNATRREKCRLALAALGPEADRGPVAVALSRQGTPGIAGLLASGLVRRHGWPSVVVCPRPNGGLAGSGRSGCGFDLGSAVGAALEEGILTSGGGHAAACGLGLDGPEGLGRLREFLHARFEAERPGAAPEIRIDAELRNGCLSADAIMRTVAAEARLEPWGHGVERPLYGVREAMVMGGRAHDAGHLFLDLSCEGQRFRGVWWNAPPGWEAALGAGGASGGEVHSGGTPCSVAGRLEVNEWRGGREPRLVVEAARRA